MSSFGPRSGKDEAVSGPGDAAFDRLAFAESSGYKDEPEFSVDNRQKEEFAQGSYLGKEAAEEPAPRSNMMSAEMEVLPEETEESIARRSGLLAAEAAVSAPARPPITRPVEARRDVDQEEFEALRKKVLNYDDTLFLMVDSEMITSEFLTKEYAEAIGDALKEQGVYKGNKSGRPLGSYVLSFYGPKIREIERFIEMSDLRQKSQRAASDVAAAAMPRPPNAGPAPAAQKKKSSP